MAILSELPNAGVDAKADADPEQPFELRTDLTVDEKLAQAEMLKVDGNKAFERGDQQMALKNWHSAILFSAGINSFASLYGSKSSEEQNIKAAEITSTVYNNMAACYIKQGRWEKAIFATSKTLAIAPKNLKALYRRAQSYLELGRTTLAAKDIDLALDLRPEDATIRWLGEQLVQAFDREEQKRSADRDDSHAEP